MWIKKFMMALTFVAATQLLSAQLLHAMGSSNNDQPAAKAADPNFDMGKQAIDAKDWPSALKSFRLVVGKDPKNADAFNYMGYAHRQMGDYASAFKAYGEALAINPNHKGANEYIGEAYLKTGNLEKAEMHLAKLDDICTFGCAEYTMLKRKVAEFKAAQN
ncbi:tetratricopeptide repeat protein [Sneathiella sp. P13V-1]|uniref:tetratricopeptide repeat protein n=1 Tax=Sneathiella sp. P13V-1 TaxID=2697366 RepID=UPI00187BAD2B|nr:tetratricopeptide repeat protein [Sneathiella sp. P13V-1]MBE7636981.1 tetratricopeptide repeat protein [Sneathiella sp. P13V-1]